MLETPAEEDDGEDDGGEVGEFDAGGMSRPRKWFARAGACGWKVVCGLRTCALRAARWRVEVTREAARILSSKREKSEMCGPPLCVRGIT